MKCSPARLAGPVVALLTTLPGGPLSATSAPDQALQRLKAGNVRFVAGTTERMVIDRSRRTQLETGQTPLAIVLSCADARVSPEFVFDANLGELYVIRTAGHVADPAVVASIEHAAGELHTPLLVVMGHDSCDLVRKTVDGATDAPSPNMSHVIDRIRPAAEHVADRAVSERLQAAVLAHVEYSINEILQQSPTVSQLVDAGSVHIVGAFHDIGSGRVVFTKPVTMAPLLYSRPTTGGSSSDHTAASDHTPTHQAQR